MSRLRRTVSGVLLMSLSAVFPASADTWAVVHARILPSPSAAAVENGTLLVRDGKIAAFGLSGAVKVPKGARRVDGSGATLLAGFWNVHVADADVKRLLTSKELDGCFDIKRHTRHVGTIFRRVGLSR